MKRARFWSDKILNVYVIFFVYFTFILYPNALCVLAYIMWKNFFLDSWCMLVDNVTFLRRRGGERGQWQEVTSYVSFTYFIPNLLSVYFNIQFPNKGRVENKDKRGLPRWLSRQRYLACRQTWSEFNLSNTHDGRWEPTPACGLLPSTYMWSMHAHTPVRAHIYTHS